MRFRMVLEAGPLSLPEPVQSRPGHQGWASPPPLPCPPSLGRIGCPCRQPTLVPLRPVVPYLRSALCSLALHSFLCDPLQPCPPPPSHPWESTGPAEQSWVGASPSRWLLGTAGSACAPATCPPRLFPALLRQGCCYALSFIDGETEAWRREVPFPRIRARKGLTWGRLRETHCSVAAGNTNTGKGCALISMRPQAGQALDWVEWLAEGMNVWTRGGMDGQTDEWIEGHIQRQRKSSSRTRPHNTLLGL